MHGKTLMVLEGSSTRNSQLSQLDLYGSRILSQGPLISPSMGYPFPSYNLVHSKLTSVFLYINPFWA